VVRDFEIAVHSFCRSSRLRARMMMTTQGTGQGAGIGRAAFLRG